MHHFCETTVYSRAVTSSQLFVFSTDEEERTKLQELASAEGADLLMDYCKREKRTYADVLGDFPSARPPLARWEQQRCKGREQQRRKGWEQQRCKGREQQRCKGREHRAVECSERFARQY